SALERLGNARRALEEIARDVPSLAAAADRVEEARGFAADATASVRRFLEGFEADPARIAAVAERLDVLNRILDRYRTDEAGVLAKLRATDDEIATLETSSISICALEGELRAALGEMEASGAELTKKRRAAAPALEKEVAETLAQLGMPRAGFAVRIEAAGGGDALARSRADGFDDVAFELAANPGEPARPLARVASGGELARVALAIEAACSAVAAAPTIVFDEIDENVGGRLAPALGRHLRRSAADRQVVVVTHLAGVAAYADRHLQVEKHVEGKATRTRVRPLDEDARVGELAEMLAGGGSRETARAEARALLAEARSAGVVRPAKRPARPAVSRLRRIRDARD
ncbi:MAG TPA: DNA repair protein RecN, partial [Planctomycetota bacterium]|nr:DNA repair protein RecN [Planctomycetota bacterium]